MQYDYVIVGGGSAGCVLANRLSANKSIRVCLVEAGPDTPPENTPKSIYDDAFLPDYFEPHRYWTELTAYADPIGNRSDSEIAGSMKARRYEQAKVMGGGSSVNGQVVIRGLPSDYDEWEAAGASGWSYADCLPYFNKLENDVDFPKPINGEVGPIPVRRVFPQHWSSFALAMREMVAAEGIPYVDDTHADPRDSCFPFARNNLYDHRVSAAAAYLTETVRRRPNLDIIADTKVTEILFATDGRTVTGVRLRGKEAPPTLDAREVIVSAGALQSPAILLRAGIGPGEHLRDMGIAVRSDLQGVGRNLLDHPLIGYAVFLSPQAQLNTNVKISSLMHMRWSSGVEGCTATDMKLTVSGRFAWSKVGRRIGMVNFGPNKAYSQGYVNLKDRSPESMPFVAFNYLSDQRDMERVKRTALWVSKLLSSPAMREQVISYWPGIYADNVRKYTAPTLRNKIITDVAAQMLDMQGLRKFVLGKAMDSRFPLEGVLKDERVLEDWIHTGIQGDWHPCGTCRMGAEGDRRAVVSPDGRVFGVSGLRVTDASIMPTVPCANINLSTMMLAEKMADQISGKSSRG
jgi:5-(hydroxymethyl)furfural/furfural oxidase